MKQPVRLEYFQKFNQADHLRPSYTQVFIYNLEIKLSMLNSQVVQSDYTSLDLSSTMLLVGPQTQRLQCSRTVYQYNPICPFRLCNVTAVTEIAFKVKAADVSSIGNDL